MIFRVFYFYFCLCSETYSVFVMYALHIVHHASLSCNGFIVSMKWAASSCRSINLRVSEPRSTIVFVLKNCFLFFFFRFQRNTRNSIPLKTSNYVKAVLFLLPIILMYFQRLFACARFSQRVVYLSFSRCLKLTFVLHGKLLPRCYL